jgi:D-serine deaminase-like pyridoxal phosphate-dependent protein
MESWFTIKDIEKLDTPAMVVYPDRIEKNINTAIRMTDGIQRLRPHVKTHKNPEVTKRMISAGIVKFKCATIAEAEMLAQCNAKDVLLAYQPVGPKIHRFISLIKEYASTSFSCLIDHPTASELINREAEKAEVTIDVYIDLNVGMNRTGILPSEAALQLYQAAAQHQHLKPLGLHAYDGHIRDKDFNIRKQHCDQKFKEVEDLAFAISEAGFPPPRIIAGGSPTFSIHSTRQNIECSPGTFIYWDAGYADLCPEQSFLPAALVVTRVISLPSPGKVCTDLGHKSVAAENEINRRVVFLNAPELKVISQSEEHLVLETSHNHHLQPGDVLYGIPYHICPTVALYERVITIEKGLISGEWKNVARDRKIKN